MQQFLNYLPQVLQDVLEMQYLGNTDDLEISALWEKIDQAYTDQWLYEMGEYGIERWEKILGLKPMGTATLEDRRFAILNRLNLKLPYTYRAIEQHLTLMCGEGGFTMSYDEPNWLLKVLIGLSAKKQYDDVAKILREMIPANIILDMGLKYNRHEDLGRYRHIDLEPFTHQQLREEILP